MSDLTSSHSVLRPTEAQFTKLHPTATSAVRRSFPRFRVDLDVSIGSDHNFYGGLVENMSVGGVFVATHMLRAVGEQIELTVYLPETDKTVRGVGEVRWTREYSERSNVPPGMGIRFIELEQGAQELIDEFLAQREPLVYDD